MGLMLAILLRRKDQEKWEEADQNRRMFLTHNQIVWFCQPIRKAWLFFAADLPRVKPHPSLSILARNINREKKKGPKLEIKVDSA